MKKLIAYKKTYLKKLFCLAVLLFSAQAIASAQDNAFYRATSYAYRTNTGNCWSNWTDWLESDILIQVDFDNDVITTNGKDPQKYYVITYGKKYTDSHGGTQVNITCIDHEGIRCTVRLRAETNNNVQLYIDYADISLVFNIKKIR